MRLWRLLSDRVRQSAAHRYWQRRARRHGGRAVLNLAHSSNELPEVTRRQQELLFPLLRQQLRGDEQLLLDFGCGTGRFTSGLADLTSARVIGLDPIDALLELAPPHAAVIYQQLKGTAIPLADASVDVVWVCVVLGSLTSNTQLLHTVQEIERVLRPGGLLFLVENTAAKPPGRHFHYRSISEYQRLFSRLDLRHLADYEDVGECISVLVGRRISG